MGCRLVSSPSIPSFLYLPDDRMSAEDFYGGWRGSRRIQSQSLPPLLPLCRHRGSVKETLQSGAGPQEDISTCFLYEQEISSTPGSVIRSMLSVTSGGSGNMIFTVGLCKERTNSQLVCVTLLISRDIGTIDLAKKGWDAINP